jgi:hypothetical protein
MKKYKYLIASTVIIIVMILIILPNRAERIYILYNENIANCTSSLVNPKLEKESYLICNESEFIHLIKNENEMSKTMDIKEINNLNIISNEELLRRFNNDMTPRESFDLDLLKREKKIDLNLIFKDSISNKIEIVPVNRVIELCKLEV